MDTQQQIQLGQAQNLAVQRIGQAMFSHPDEYEKAFKTWTMRFYKWMDDNRKDIIFNETLKTKEEPAKREATINPLNDLKKQVFPSLRQKYCPKCKVIIPKTWTKHIECGWVEQ